MFLSEWPSTIVALLSVEKEYQICLELFLEFVSIERRIVAHLIKLFLRVFCIDLFLCHCVALAVDASKVEVESQCSELR